MKIPVEQLQEWAKQIYEIATTHGWHEQPNSPEHYLCLIMTELAEAVEADRNSRRADLETFDRKMTHLDGSDECFKEMYKRYIKGSIEEEFADVVIRLIDMAVDIHGDKMIWVGYFPYGERFDSRKSFSENAWFFIHEVLNLGYMNITDSVMYIYEWAEYLRIDLTWHIKQKMKYNNLRSYKHGGKKY